MVSWMKNNLEIRSTGSLSASEIGRALQECSTELRNAPPTYLANNQIGRLLHQALPALKRKKISVHGKREWVYRGLTLSPNDQPKDCSASDSEQQGNSVELLNTRTILCAEQCSICDICRQLPWYMVKKGIKNFEAVSDVKDEFTRLCFILTRFAVRQRCFIYRTLIRGCNAGSTMMSTIVKLISSDEELSWNDIFLQIQTPTTG